ncbi:NAD(P)-dependent oxidoreductase [Paenibacillus sp. CGMCC 1.16610]|uniref:NAD-dependent epimerase/dehydratase family protein n=1 Tax=Paenibacillus anseongense TaxID=2682845 RepID=A0ABW9U8E4_9BACL|nr:MULTISPECIES: NAD(P)-dependent oxidoreductase [Paenibacillus]MBA2937336.1 NAD(P)-dependent oxidoreductase [Paenibacillus sp. CGMCC 1.16610]MVQ36394.1 NAD-dependent epimerase/dehydratase family protein [Paenibacillus anseongense]
MKIFAAGATGAVGRILLPKLIHAGHEVIGITQSESKKAIIENMGAKALIADVFDRESIRSALDESQPEVVIHQLTSLSNRNFSDNTRIRKEGTQNLVDAAISVGIKRIIAQSISWAYEPGERPASEDEPLHVVAEEPRKSTIDGILALENEVSKIPQHVILRYGMFYGPGTWYERNGFMAKLIHQRQVPATEGVTSFLHVEDAAEAALLALQWPSGPVNIVDDEPARGTDWLPVFAQALGAPTPETTSNSNAWERGASNRKARQEYGWKPLYPTWRTGFSASLADENNSMLDQ